MDEDRQRKFLDLLWKEQREQELSDYRLAKELGVAQSTVSRLRSGVRGVGNELMFRAAQRFPTIRIFLASEFLNSNDRIRDRKEEAGAA